MSVNFSHELSLDGNASTNIPTSLKDIKILSSDKGCTSCSSSVRSDSPASLIQIALPTKSSGTGPGELGDRERDVRRPFTRKFRTKHGFYVFDVNTNRIVPVNHAIYEIIDDFGVLSVDEMIRKYSDVIPHDDIREAFTMINAARNEQQLFLNHRPSEIMYPLDEQSLRRLYDERLQTMTLGVTEQCNLRCTYCGFSGTYEGHRVHNSKLMSFDVARKALDFLEQHSRLCEYVNLAFYGGEPLLGSRLIKQCVAYANEIFRRRSVRYHMTTNGTLLTDENCRLLIDNDFGIMISVDGPKSIHDRYRLNVSEKGTYDRIATNLARLQRLDPVYYENNVRFSIVMPPPYDFRAIEEFINYSPLARVARMRTAFVDDQDTTFFNRFSKDELNASEVLNELKQEYRGALIAGEINHHKPAQHHKFKLGLFAERFDKLASRMSPTNPFPEVYHPGGICIPGMKTLFVTPEGNLFTCEKSSTATEKLQIGTLAEGLDASKGMANIMEYSNTHDGCRYCYASRHCGTCFVKAYSNGRFDRSTKVRQCNAHRSGFHSDLVDLMTVIEENPSAIDYVKDMSFI